MLSYLKNLFKPKIVVIEHDGNTYYAVRKFNGNFLDAGLPDKLDWFVESHVLKYAIVDSVEEAEKILEKYNGLNTKFKVKKYASN